MTPWSAPGPRTSLAEMRQRSRDMRREWSRFCPGFCLPYHLLFKLDRAERRRMYRQTAAPVQRAAFDRAIRVFFENGVEVRILPGRSIETRIIYHVHPWLRLVRPSRGRPLTRPLFEVSEETIGYASWGMNQICAPDLSAHERFRHEAVMRTARGNGKSPLLIDATLMRDVWISGPAFALHIHRPTGGGIGIRPLPLRLDGELPARKPFPVRNQRQIIEAAELANQCLSALPLLRRHLLLLAQDVAPLLVIWDAATARAADAFGALFHNLSHRLSRRFDT